MLGEEFARCRALLEKTQPEMAVLIGTSVKAVRSYEQGWRSVPAHVERQVYFLLTRKFDVPEKTFSKCWEINRCPDELKLTCPAWEFKAGDFCWFINGTICGGVVKKDWKEKMETCRHCPVLTTRLPVSLSPKK